MAQVTLKEIADILGISVTTVSKALKDYKDVSEETKKKVRELAAELDYQPNAMALSLRNQESRTIGLIIPEIAHHFFANIINGIILEAEKHGYLVIILQSNESFDLETKQIDLLLNKRVDGILMSLSNETDSLDAIRKIINNGTPLVLFDKISKMVNCSKVIIDDQKAAYEATEHLIKAGCKKIAHFRGPLNPQGSIDRFLGYKRALEDHNIAYDQSLVFICNRISSQEGFDYAQQVIKDHPDVDGIFCITDLVAAGAMSYFNKNGIKVPEQIAIIGFSNWPISSLLTPSLSTVDQPGTRMGKEALGILVDEINAKKKKDPIEHHLVQLPTKLIARNSSNKA
ncbi:LacI family DNA-binding transcriptional regulator [Spongiivirga sp. MCCC 1A20706]|uniref:LacI family DNA-binding transcriptional regulator n=1 Tax=Spongiivirga sp. MCCC 1A20706 TaxID=3160963 RepID=UPI0039773C03